MGTEAARSRSRHQSFYQIVRIRLYLQMQTLLARRQSAGLLAISIVTLGWVVVRYSLTSNGVHSGSMAAPSFHFPRVEHAALSSRRRSDSLAICVRLKNEALYLREWIEFHRIAGVGHFHIFDDGSTDGTIEVLRPYVEHGIVTLQEGVDHRHDSEHGQNGHRDLCLAQNPSNATWLAMLDADEFLFPSEGFNVATHLASDKCQPPSLLEPLPSTPTTSASVSSPFLKPLQLSFLMVRWHVFGANGLKRRPSGLVLDHYRMRQRPSEAACPAKWMGCFEQAPPLSTKLIVNTQCVAKVGTHYVMELHPDAAARGCTTLYTPLGSKTTRLAYHRGQAGAAVGTSVGFLDDIGSRIGLLGADQEQSSLKEFKRRATKSLHRSCAGQLHLNHYAVKSREDYLVKFQRGRISRSAADLASGLATRNATTGQAMLKPLPPEAVAAFLNGDNAVRRHHRDSDSVDSKNSSTEKSTKDRNNKALEKVSAKLLELAVKEFAVRDFSEVRDEAILKYLPLLKLRLLGTNDLPQLPTSVHMTRDSASHIDGAADGVEGGHGMRSRRGRRPRAHNGRSRGVNQTVRFSDQLLDDGSASTLGTGHRSNGVSSQKHSTLAALSRYRLDPGWPRAPVAVSPLCQGLPSPLGDPNDASNFIGRRGHQHLLPVGGVHSSDELYGVPPSPQQPLLLLHVPKTGGTNFNLQLAHTAQHLQNQKEGATSPTTSSAVAGAYCEVATSDAHRRLPPQLQDPKSASTQNDLLDPSGAEELTPWSNWLPRAIYGRSSKSRVPHTPATEALLSSSSSSSAHVAAGGCSIVSGELDVSIVAEVNTALKKKWLKSRKKTKDLSTSQVPEEDVEGRAAAYGAQPITMLRDPIARAVSQFEHHRSRGRFQGQLHRWSSTSGDSKESLAPARALLLQLVNPQMCHQSHARPTEQCNSLSSPLKCNANGWCGVFQDHQTEALAGFGSLPEKQRVSKRRSRDQLLCAAHRSLTATLVFVGVAEHYDASICLLLHTFRMDTLFDECCRGTASTGSKRCALLELRTKTNSEDERSHVSSSSSSKTPPSSSESRGGYLAEYLSDPKLLAALYDGHRADCELYSAALELFARRLSWMERERKLVPGSFSSLVVQQPPHADSSSGSSADGDGSSDGSSDYSTSGKKYRPLGVVQSPLCVRAAAAYHALQKNISASGL